MLMVRKFAYGLMVFAAMSAASAFAAGTLPAGYAELEYIQGNGTDARIATGYVPNPLTDKVEAVVEWSSSVSGALSGNQGIWCARGKTTSENTWTLHMLGNQGSKFRFDYKTTSGDLLEPAVSTDVKYTVTADRNIVTWSGGNGQTHKADIGFSAAGNQLVLFGVYSGTTIDVNAGNYGKYRLYSFKVWRAGVLKHYFVPCKDGNGVATMVDICDNPATLTKSGTFTAGAEGHFYDYEGAISQEKAWAAGVLPSGYTELEYIQGNGTDARIITDYIPHPQTDKIEAVVEWTSDPGVSSIWCARGNSTSTDTYTLFVLNNNHTGYKFRFDYKSTTGNELAPALVKDTKYTATADRNEFTWSGGDGQTHTAVDSFMSAGGPMTLFATYYNGTGNNTGAWSNHRLYSLKVWRSGDILHYFVPCKDANGVATMFDVCGGSAKSVAEGTFAAGTAGHYYDDSLFPSSDVLQIAGSPGKYGVPAPAYGIHGGLSAGDTFAVSCEPSTNAGQMVEYYCTGWKLYNEAGTVVSNGTETAFTYTHPTPAEYRRLEWQFASRSLSTICDETLPIAGAAFHVDASAPSTLTTVESGEKQIVTAWRDVDGGTISATAGSSSRPWLVTDDGLPYVDFGPQTKGNGTAAGDTAGHLTWSSQLTTIREVFLVFSDYPGSAHSFFLGDSSVYHFHRNQKKLFNTTYASAYVQNGLIEVDGVVRDVSYTLPEGFHIIHLRTTGVVTANRFAQDRTENFGGQRLQEVIVYTKTLTDAEAEATYDYLEGKWFSNPGVLEVDGSPEQLGSPSPAYGVQVGIAAGATVPVSCGATIVSNAEETAYGCVGWKLYDKDDNVISSGEGTSFTYEHPTPAEYRRLEWQWVKLLTILPIPDQVNETFDPCRPEFTVFNRVSGATYTVGGDRSSPYFDVEYTGNDAVGTANVVAIGKGEFAGLSANGNFNITATKREDENIYTTDVTARRREVAGKYVYVFTNAAAAQVSTAKRNLAMTDYLVVGGGGGGGNAMGGGGGGGGVTNATGIARALLSEGDTFMVSVGAGGAGAGSYNSKGANGKATSLQFGNISISVAGGGGGGSAFSGAGAAGASGGGGSVSGAGGAGIDGIGYAGATVANSRTGGGGGGAGHEGYPYTDSPARAGNGGEGIVSSITGEAVYYGGGGGGGADSCDPGFGGLGGGGDGKKKAAGQPGTDGFGGGGGGGSWLGSNSDSRNCGGNGGSGTVILALRPGDFNIESIPDQYLDVGAGGGCTPEPVVRTSDGVTLLTKDVDYTVSYTGNTQSGNAILTVTGINGQSGKVCEISFKIYLRYFVDSEAGPGGDGSAASPFATISNAVEKAKTDIGGGALLVEIDVAVGTYNETGFVLDVPIVIVGANRNGVEIVDNVVGSRAFTLSHESAEVRNLTISGGGLKTNNGQGGHVRMTAGLVSNCVIKDGRAGASAGYGNGGNVWMSGGRLERCLVTGGTANWGGFSASESCGMGLYATGGIIDSCWFKDNKTDNSDGHNSASVYLNGAATMVNCTVTGGWARNYKGKGSGIHIANAGAKVVNCVAYGNYVGKGTISNTAVSNFGSGNFDRYFYCGSSFTNTSCATWTVLTDEDFLNYVTFTGTAEADLKTYFNSAAYASFDWHQRLSSAIVDGGTMDTAYRPEDSATLDLDGGNRVSGVSIDLGCWERDQSQFECAGRLANYGALEDGNVVFRAMAYGPAFDVVFRWDYGNGVTNDTRDATHVYAYPSAGYFTVRISASPNGGLDWTEWYTLTTRLAVAPARMYVDSNCATPVFPYKTRETAAATLGAVVGSLTNNVSENKTIIGGVDIVILNGSRSNDTGCFLATAVTVRGETGNPADAEIVDNVAGSRAFTLTHPDAVVSNLTISGLGFRTTGSPSGGGGHVWMSAGLVANCIIKNGRASGQKGTAHGGNVYMTGGRIERCLVTGGMANWGGYANESDGMGLYAAGGIIDNCWFKDNKDDTSDDGHNDGSVCLDGAVTMVNCTVTGGLSRDYSGHGTGIYVKNANAKVVNCVAYGNYSYFRTNPAYATNSLASNCGNANLGRYFHCGSAFTNTSCATWTVLTDADFVNYSSCTGRTWSAVKTYLSSEDYANFDWHQKRHSQLIDHGTKDTAYRPADSVTLDIDGNPRVLNKSIDLGCWEVLVSSGFQILVR